jgi:hypothetical protein
MADYLSQYTGQQVDNAVSIALNLDATLTDYIKTKDIGDKVAGLDSSGKISIDALPAATSTVKGVIQAGIGLTVTDGVLSVDSGLYYSKDETTNLLNSLKGDIVIPTKLSAFTNDIISATPLDENNYQIVIK